MQVCHVAHLCSGCRAVGVEELGELVCGGLIEGDLIAALVWAGSGVAAGRFDDRVLESRRRGAMVGVWLRTRPRLLACDFGFRPFVSTSLLRRRALRARVCGDGPVR